MTNTTKNTTTSIFLALSVAMTMGVANATSVPGIGTDVFEFSKPGIAADANVTGTGVDALSNMNSILTSVGTTGGATFDTDKFWESMVGTQKQNVFEYTTAKPMIDELVFTVTGDAYGTQQGSTNKDWFEASSVQARNEDGSYITVGGNIQDAKTVFLSKGSNTEVGNYVDGKLSLTKGKAIELMGLLGYTADTSNLEAVTFGGPAHPTSHVIEKVNDSRITDAIALADVNRAGFNNANLLIELIADQLKTGYILDVDKAAEALAAISAHHTKFLGADLVNKANGLKPLIKAIGIQEAAVGVGIGAQAACVDSVDQSVDKSSITCIAVGTKFNDLMGKLPTQALSNDMVTAYKETLVSLSETAGFISGFTAGTNGFVAGDVADTISDEFGTITVDLNSTLYTTLEDNTIDNPTLSDAVTGAPRDVEDFDASFEFIFDLGADNLSGGTGINEDRIFNLELN